MERVMFEKYGLVYDYSETYGLPLNMMSNFINHLIENRVMVIIRFEYKSIDEFIVLTPTITNCVSLDLIQASWFGSVDHIYRREILQMISHYNNNNVIYKIFNHDSVNVCVIYDVNVINMDDIWLMYDQTQKAYMKLFSNETPDSGNFYIEDQNSLHIKIPFTQETNIYNINKYKTLSFMFRCIPFGFDYTLKKNTFPLTKEIVEYVFHPKRMERMSAEYGIEMCEYMDLY